MLISIIVPCYNSERYLSDCLLSILNQTYVNWEVICIDDGSQDNTLSILNHYATLDERFKIISQSNAGVSVARNKALSQCQGEYICFVDSDDLIEPNFLITLLQLISHQADLAICGFTRSMVFCMDDAQGYIEMSGKRCIERIILDKSFNPQICCMLFRHNIIKEKQLEFVIGCTRGEDREFILKYLVYSNKVCYTNNLLYHYRVNDQSAMAIFSIKSLTSIEASQRTVNYYKKVNYSVRGLEFEFSRTLWKFMILAILSGQNDLYQIIREKYDLKRQMEHLYSHPGLSEKLTARLFVWNVPEMMKKDDPKVEKRHPNFLGAMLAVWNDRVGNGISQQDVHVRTFPALQVVCEKMWKGENAEHVSYAQFKALCQSTPEAPGVNLLAKVPQRTILTDIGKEVTLSGTDVVTTSVDEIGYPYAVEFEICPDSIPNIDAILFKGPHSEFITNWQNTGKFAFRRDGYEFVFYAYRLPVEKWTKIRIEGDIKGTSLFVDGQLLERLEGRIGEVFNVKHQRKDRIWYQETLIFPLKQLGDTQMGFNGKVKNLICTPR